jgi:protein-tyrosine-phosphatase
MLEYLKGRDEVTISMVCLGNICRSPMAAAILHKFWLIALAPALGMLEKVQIRIPSKLGRSMV